MKFSVLALSISILVVAIPSHASQNGHNHGSKYAGQEHREIKSLSADDVSELRRGGGWGLAKSAELNGVPGPAHLLELKDQIHLDARQVREIETLYAEMKAAAMRIGDRLIARERELEHHFQNRTITDDILRSSLAAISETRKELRYTHLSTHLRTPEILSDAQIAKYNALRGYARSNPCDTVPEGHNAEMWKKHNGCD